MKRFESVIIAAVVLSPCIQIAKGEVVVYDNRDRIFEWTQSVNVPASDPVYGSYLDITQPPTQSGEHTEGAFTRWLSWGGGSSSPTTRRIQGEDASTVALLDYSIEVEWNSDIFNVIPLREYHPTETIGSQANWNTHGRYYYHLTNIDSFETGTPLISDLAYFGVKRVVDGQVNYGWILLKDYTKPVMWAYETEPGMAIQIPIPAPSAGLGLAVLSGFARRRR